MSTLCYIEVLDFPEVVSQGDKVRRRHGWVNWLLPANSRPSTPAPLTSPLVVQGEEVHKSFAEMEVQTPAIKSAIDNGHSSTSRPSGEQTSVALEHYTSAAEESDERVMLAKAEGEYSRFTCFLLQMLKVLLDGHISTLANQAFPH
jgi:hypothetical protein